MAKSITRIACSDAGPSFILCYFDVTINRCHIENLFIKPPENLRSQLPKKARHGRLCTHRKKNVQVSTQRVVMQRIPIFGGFLNYFQYHIYSLHASANHLRIPKADCVTFSVRSPKKKNDYSKKE